jgi:hypothetical protein
MEERKENKERREKKEIVCPLPLRRTPTSTWSRPHTLPALLRR